MTEPTEFLDEQAAAGRYSRGSGHRGAGEDYMPERDAGVAAAGKLLSTFEQSP